jgi:uncharacterized membrane protein YdjX (TVP38/TMEM64 family)
MRKKRLVDDHGTIEDHEGAFSGEKAGGEFSSSGLKDLVTVLIVGIVFLTLALFFRSDLAGNLSENIQNIRSFLKSGAVPGGLAGSGAVFVVVTGLLISMGVPRIWISALGGAVYGALLGAALSLCSTIIGATTLFVAGSTFLGPVVERRFGSRAGKFVERLSKDAFWWTLYLRLFPFSNSTVQSLLFGSLRVPFTAYISGSILGFIPLTIVFAVFGSGGVKGNYNQIWLGFALIAAVALVQYLMNRIAKGKAAENGSS